MTLLERNADEAAFLRELGHKITTDDELVAAAAEHYGMSENTIRIVFAGDDDVVTVDR